MQLSGEGSQKIVRAFLYVYTRERLNLGPVTPRSSDDFLPGATLAGAAPQCVGPRYPQ